LLRLQPGTVHDFFGQPWVARFCGSAAAATTASHIAPEDVASLRKNLRRLYSTVFAIHDPGLTTNANGEAIPIYDRYVVHDLIETLAEMSQPESDSSPAQEPTHTEPDNESPTARRTSLVSRSRRYTLENEIGTAPNELRVLLGGPGTGKSALLRYVALDLLAESPRLPAVAQAWGRRLPIWMPFGAWVERIDRGGRNVSLTEVIHDWLLQWEAGNLFPIVERALQDKRLLLLVDGLDEWTSEQAARIAVAQLRVFAQLQGVPIVLTSRPHGFRMLSSELPGWRVIELAPLSDVQQLTMAVRWFRQCQRASEGDASDDTLIHRQARDALSELRQIPDAAGIVEVPLLLDILLLRKWQNVELPSNRFRAYAELTRHLRARSRTTRARGSTRGPKHDLWAG
jgi:predicted NACHT family NTPase